MTPQAVRTTNRGIVSVHATVQDITDPASGMVETYALCNMLFYPPEADEEEPVFLETRESINCQQCARLVALVAIAKEYARGSISKDGYSKISADYHLWCDSVVPSSMMSETEFGSLYVDQKVALMVEVFGPELAGRHQSKIKLDRSDL